MKALFNYPRMSSPKRTFLTLLTFLLLVGSALGQGKGKGNGGGSSSTSEDYLCFTAESNNSSLVLQKYGNPASISLHYRLNGEEWQDYSIGEVISLALGEYVEFEAKSTNSTFSEGADNYYYFQMEGKLAGSGPLGGLLKSKSQNSVEVKVPEYGFYKLFSYCGSLTSAPTLPTQLSSHSYHCTFEYCTGLTEPAPAASNMKNNGYSSYCFYAMYQGCSGLTTTVDYKPTQSPATYSCAYMYADCIGLTEVADFPELNLGISCYAYMFKGCTGLTKAPALPSTSLAKSCYSDMFNGCTALESAPALPATTMAESCYKEMFQGCTSLEVAPTLPATQLTTDCYDGMFKNCSSLNSIAVSFTQWSDGNNTTEWVSGVSPMGKFICPDGLTAIVGASWIPKGWIKQRENTGTREDYFYILAPTYGNGINITVDKSVPLMFSVDNCLTWRPVAQSQWNSNLNNYSISKGNRMYFKSSKGDGTFSSKDVRYKIKVANSFEAGGNIMSLIDPTCKMTEVPAYAFAGLFEGATNLKKAPDLPFTTLGEGCYMDMFKGCTGLTSAPELPATELAESCYEGMFQNCTSLKAAPTLPATQMEDRCYANMFNGCSALNTMKVSFTEWTTDNDNCATKDWVKDVPHKVNDVTGTFIKPASLNAEYGDSRIPVSNSAKWSTQVDMLCFTALTDNATIKLVKVGTPADLTVSIKWKGVSNGTFDFTNSVTLSNIGDKVYIYADGINPTFSGGNGDSYRFEITGEVEASGNVMSLLDGSCNTTEVPELGFAHLFDGCSGLKKAPEFIASIVNYYSCEYMFANCTGLTAAPKLPATALGNNCYHCMFMNCSSMTYVPDLEAQIVSASGYGAFGNNCYEWMFENCTSLVNAPAIKSKTVSTSCYKYMFKGCSALENAPELPAILTNSGHNSCYEGMFQGCSSLKRAPELPTQDLSNTWNAYRLMFDGCSSLEYLNAGFKTWCNNNTENWVQGVPDRGIFVCDYDLIKDGKTFGTSYIPWNPDDVNKQWSTIHDYLCFTAETEGSTVRIQKVGNPTSANLVYSRDGGHTWIAYGIPDDKNASGPIIDGVTDLQAGEMVYFRNAGSNGRFSENASNYYKFVMEGSFKVSGKVISLLDQYCQDVEIPDYAFTHLFDGGVSLSTTPEMPGIGASLGEGCYSYMFKGCNRITKAQALPATDLAPSCYAYMFYGCTKLVTAPELPATTLAANCYNSMFRGCKYLTSAPALPAITLTDGCYNNMFYGCSRLKWMGVAFGEWNEGSTDNWVYGVPKKGTFDCTGIYNLQYGPSRVPKNIEYPWAITYDGLCFTAQEDGVTVKLDKVTKAGETNNGISLQYSNNNIYWIQYTIGEEKTLAYAGDKIYFRSTSNATQNFNNSTETYYHFVFNEKKVAASGSVLFLLKQNGAVTSVPNYAFANLFKDCTSLISAPSLPASIVKKASYYGMFSGCTSLTQAPVLPATTIGNSCYKYMFRNCSSLVNAPELPANVLESNCYLGMFQGCTSLTSGPSLFPTQTASGCYQSMFSGCKSLSYLSVGFTSWNRKIDDPEEPEISFTKDWVKGVSQTGVFSCPAELPIEFVEVNTTDKSNRIPYDKDNHWTIVNPFSLTAEEATTISLIAVGKPEGIELEYSWDGKKWRTYDLGAEKYLATDERIYFRATNSNPDNTFSTDRDNYYQFKMNGGSVEAGGNIMSLIDQSGSRSDLPNDAFANLFADCDVLSTAPSLPATQLSKYCYYNMFKGCKKLTTAPYLRATNLDIYCYAGMFSGCTSLTSAPVLPATELASHCYESMFENCTGLEFISVEFSQWKYEELEATTNWVKNVKNTGYFMCPSGLETDPTKWIPAEDYDSHIPEGWNKLPQYLCFTAEAENSIVQFIATNNKKDQTGNGTGKPLKLDLDIERNEFEYSYNGYNWSPYPMTADNAGLGEVITLTKIGDRVYFRHKYDYDDATLTRHIDQGKGVIDEENNISGDYIIRDNNNSYYHFKMSGKVAGSGNVVSLLNMNCNRTKALHPYTFCALFKDCTALTSAPALPEGDVLARGGGKNDYVNSSNFCYMSMFFGCTSLKYSPALPKYVGTLGCFHKLFWGCSSLEVAPELPATDLCDECYHAMFYGCSSLKEAPELPAMKPTDICYKRMFWGCTSLEKAPVLPMTSIGKACYVQMFLGCTKLKYIEVAFNDWDAGDYKDLWGQTNKGSTENWVASWGDSNTKGIFVCPSTLPQGDNYRGKKFIPKGWIVVSNNIGTLPTESGEIPAGYDFTPEKTAPEVETLEDETLGMNGKTVLHFSENGGTQYTESLKTPHYIRVDAIEMESTTTSEISGTMSISGSTLYYNSLGNKSMAISASDEVPNKMIWKVNTPDYGASFDFSVTNGLYSTITLYGKIKPHFSEPIFRIDYEKKKLYIEIPDGCPEGGKIYWSNSSTLTYDNYLEKGKSKLYEDYIDLSTWMNKATGEKIESRSFYAVIAPDNEDWKTDENKIVPSAVQKAVVYRWPMSNGYCVVKSDDATSLKNAILYAQRTASSDYHAKIFVPDGTYDLGNSSCNIYGNTSLIGESNDKTIITSTYRTGTLRMLGDASYVQDICVQNTSTSAYPAIRDYGSENVYMNCNLSANSNVYYADGDGLNRNFLKDCMFSVSNKYAVYGNGDLWFENCTFDIGSSAGLVSAQTNVLTNRYGHIFNNCTVKVSYQKAKTIFLSAPIDNSPAAAWMNVTLMDEYGFTTVRGYKSNENYLALRYFANDLVNIKWPSIVIEKSAYSDITKAFGSFVEQGVEAWDPSHDVDQSTVTSANKNNNMLKWESDAESGIFLIEATRVDDPTIKDYVITKSQFFSFYDSMEGRTLSVRAANARGGFGKALTADLPPTGNINGTLNEFGYSTFSCDHQVMIDGANAYIGKVVDDKVKFTRINAYDIVPANTGVFLVGAPAKDGVSTSFSAVAYESGFDYSVTPGSNDWNPCLTQTYFCQLEEIHHHGGNVIHPTWSDCSDCCKTGGHDCCYYVLVGQDIVRRIGQGGGVLANRAYIHVNDYVTNGAASLRLCFFEEESEGTGIDEISTETSSNTYDLNGQKTESQKGLLIKDGKVILQK